MSSSSPPSQQPPAWTGKHPPKILQRGNYTRSPSATAIFIIIRALDVPLQYYLLSGIWSVPLLSRLGISTISSGSLLSSSTLASPIALTLSPASAPAAVLLAMAAASSLKQIYWSAFLARERLPLSNAVSVPLLWAVGSSVVSLLFIAARTSSSISSSTTTFPGLLPVPVPIPVLVGMVSFSLGLALETISESQRRAFKNDPKNEGKVCKTGLWGWTRHVNFGGFALWRMGQAMAASGWVVGLAMGALSAWMFAKRAVPELDAYMTERYGEQWRRYKGEVKWMLFPGVW